MTKLSAAWPRASPCLLRPAHQAASRRNPARLTLRSIIGAESMKYIATTLGSSFYKQYQMAMLFGIVELVLSQVGGKGDGM